MNRARAPERGQIVGRWTELNTSVRFRRAAQSIEEVVGSFLRLEVLPKSARSPNRVFMQLGRMLTVES